MAASLCAEVDSIPVPVVAASALPGYSYRLTDDGHVDLYRPDGTSAWLTPEEARNKIDEKLAGIENK